MNIISVWQFLIFLSIIVLDQWTKLLAANLLEWGKSVEVIPGFLYLTLVHNRGAAFGIFSTLPDPYRGLALNCVSLLAIMIVVRFFLKDAKDDMASQFALVAILSGAIGNIIDRVRFGAVVDFIDVVIWREWHWPAFNVADSAICVGVSVLLVRMVFFAKKDIRVEAA